MRYRKGRTADLNYGSNCSKKLALMDRSTHWLTRKRLTVYPRMMVVILVVTSVAWVLLSKNMVDPKGKPLGYDFITYWAASHVGLTGHPVDAYNISLLFKAEKLAVPASDSVFVWYYPPPFYLVILPAALLPYLAAYWVFVLSTLAFYVAVFRRIVHNSTAMWCLAAFSGVWINLSQGQNAFLTAALAGAALLCLEERPALAGVFIGLLAVKPHLALLFPVALIAIRAWRAFIAAAVTTVAFTAIGTAVFGVATLNASLASLRSARLFLQSGLLSWPKMPTIFAFLRLLGAPVMVAYVVHGIVAVAAVLAVWRMWRRSGDWQLRGAALMTATFLISPYVFDYDLAWLAFPIAWMALAGYRNGWLRGEREVLTLSWLLPLLISPIATRTSVQIGPFVLMTLLWMIMRRADTVFMVASTAIHDSAGGPERALSTATQ
jgi:hypothetical protein